MPTVPNITQMPSRVTRASEVIWLPAWKTATGDVIQTSDQKLPILPLMEPVAVSVYHIYKFKPYSDAEFKAENNSVNASPWRGVWDKGQAWISKIFSEGLETRGNQAGETVHYVIRCIDRPDGWDMVYPDVAFGATEFTTPLPLLKEAVKRPVEFSLINGL